VSIPKKGKSIPILYTSEKDAKTINKINPINCFFRLEFNFFQRSRSIEAKELLLDMNMVDLNGAIYTIY
jgi:hypothetical protein